MKENEIMIGDWLHLHYNNQYSGDVSFYFKVTQLNRNGSVLYVYGESLDGNHHGNMGDVREIEPIPLTPEVLIKIGFEKFKTAMGREYYELPIEKAYIRFDTDFACRIQGPNGNFEYKNIMFVQELQHALRICGIEKEIEL